MAMKIPKIPDGLKYPNVQGVIPGNDYEGRGTSMGGDGSTWQALGIVLIIVAIALAITLCLYKIGYPMEPTHRSQYTCQDGIEYFIDDWENK